MKNSGAVSLTRTGIHTMRLGDIENAINNGEKFTYTQNGETIAGHYDATTNTFVGVGNRITTVLNPRNPTTYIANLKARQ